MLQGRPALANFGFTVYMRCVRLIAAPGSLWTRNRAVHLV